MEMKRSPVLYIVLVAVLAIILIFAYFQLKSPATESESEASIENCGEGTAIYQNNRLCWQRGTSSKVNGWQEANSYCENLELGGRTDWRLPTTEELKSIVDDSYKKPAIDPTYFPNTEPIHFWTSSLYRENIHWYIHFELGYQGFAPDITNNFLVRCVRDSTLL